MLEALSDRGKMAFETILRPDFEIFFEAMGNLYDVESNPNGAFPLNVAENVLSWDILKEKIKKINAEVDLPKWVAGYTSCNGHPEVLEVFANFYSNFIAKCEIEASHLALSAGATSVIEMTSLLLSDPGDVVVIPAPSYPVYTNDVGNKSGMQRYDLKVNFNWASKGGYSPLVIEDLEQAKIEIERKSQNFRLLILTSPDNPTGCIYTQDQLEQIAHWCMDNKIHLVVNEIYALSLINVTSESLKEDYGQVQGYTSFAQLMRKLDSPYLHLWYALSKDFGISGFRVGLLHSRNESLIKAYDNYNGPHMVSNYTQWLSQEFLRDQDFVENYIEVNQRRLNQSYEIVIETLSFLNVPYLPSRGSLFVWIDLSQFLEEESRKGEESLWLDIYKNSGVLLTPGFGFGHDQCGFFRVVYTCVQEEELEVAMQRLRFYLSTRK